ncbi:type II toxin-antitoxin system RelE/ParE family toxin [Buttiauxella selenatireducens]|uniref:Type II toxin-antitoxin system RelE/ParE family toxin n=1 Tax=Buttiauxella selenatireducens TaxID=3073902 RepID=A0ABY9SB08_9ENTR|nr:type II toxin-antitoxin system RelE/ParE family toxin [Buttiauxella sp. R73]WMY74138.1 type II toxin-antitoxin system RelE/ParE family toxin [Buttiauxella sp. R73]
MNELRQSKAFRAWLDDLQDRRIKTIVATRLLRLKNGITGDVQPVGEGISELRIHYGPGYRIYFQQRGRLIVLILCGGNKGSQSRDIALAKMLARNWIDEDEYEE